MRDKFSFSIKKTVGNSRIGEIKTKNGTIQTPCFMPVGTAATVKAMHLRDVEKCGAEIILGNTYHLMLRPGEDVIEEMGGLHKFMNWKKPILTDSGGFQVMSLSKIRKISSQGVEFSSHIDGKKILLTPEYSMQIQHKLGSDITMIFDECISYPSSKEAVEKSMHLSLDWAQRSKDAFVKRDGYGLFAIIQGGIFPDLREESTKKLIEIGFDGYAIGGLAVGEGQELMLKTLENVMPFIPEDKPRYLMGVGKPDDIIKAVKRGVDMFDCVIPTRSGRNGQAFISDGVINIKNNQFIRDKNPLDKNCTCHVCQNFSRSYLNHLVKSNEILGSMLMSEHNIYYYQKLMRNIRKDIATSR